MARDHHEDLCDASFVAFRPGDRARISRMNRHGAVIKTCAACAATYTRQTWAALAYCGTWGNDDVEALELRHCVCASTIAIKIGAERCRLDRPPAREPTQAEGDAVADDAVCDVLDLYGRPTSRVELREMLGPYSSSLPGRRAQHGLTIMVWWSRREVAETLARVIQITLQLGSATFAERNWQNGFESSPVSGNYSTTGAVFTKSITCPSTSAYPEGYTATSTELIIYFNGGQEVYVDTYQLQ